MYGPFLHMKMVLVYEKHYFASRNQNFQYKGVFSF